MSLEGTANTLKKLFNAEKADLKEEKFLKITIPSSNVRSALTYLRDSENYIHFVMMSCVDFLEEGEFELVYILCNPETQNHIILKTRIKRENAEFESMTTLWRAIETFEREIWEMYGVNFIGHNRLEPFILEDWNFAPPMRRDFDTLHHVEEHYEWREGREEKHSPREYIAEQFDEWRKK